MHKAEAPVNTGAGSGSEQPAASARILVPYPSNTSKEMFGTSASAQEA